MSARDLARSLHMARAARRAAEIAGDTAAVKAAQAEAEQARKRLAAMDADERTRDLLRPGVPMACLPVRLETAFIGDTRMRVRVYPDTLHLGGHDPRVTQTEIALAQDVAARAATEDAAALNAWMDTLVGAGRGAHIRAVVAEGTAQLKPEDAEDLPARAAALPERWQVRLTWSGGQIEANFPALVADPLTLGPSAEDVAGLFAPNALARLWQGTGGAQQGLAWMLDFDAALAAGMATEVDLTAQPDLAKHLAAGGDIDQITVSGVRWAGPEEGAETLGALMTGHAQQRDARIIPQGSATRNDGPHRTAPGSPQRDGPNSRRLASALGLGRAALRHCGDIPQDEDHVAALANTVLWPGTVGLYAEAALGLGPEDTEPLRAFFRDRLRARGPLPCLQVGAESYGVLPLTLGPDSAPIPGTAFEGVLTDRVLSAMDGVQRPDVPLRPPQTYAEWLDLFGTQPHPVTALGLPYGRVGRAMPRRTGDLLDQLDLSGAKDRLGDVTAVQDLIEVAPRLPWTHYPADATHRTDMTGAQVLATRSLDQLMSLLPIERWPVQPWREMPEVRRLIFDRGSWRVDQDGAAPGDPLVFTLLRHALFSHFAALMRAGVLAAGEDPAPLSSPDGDPSRLPLLEQFRDVTGLTEDQLTLPLDADIARRLGLSDALQAQNADLAKALPELEALTPDTLELAVREHLALVSYRPDAWATALDAARLARMRKAQPEGVLIGGYGMVRGLKPAASASGQEALVARSRAGAMTAAALREGAKRRAGLALDLSSARVGPAQEVLGALRAGRSLGAVLGQRVEMALRRDLAAQPNKLMATLDALRTAFPLREGLRGDAPEGGGNVETCDGLKALEADPATVPGPARPVVSEVRKIVDAIADLGLAEAVHGMVTGGPERAGAALDALSRGDSAPEVFEVVEDRRSGAGLEMSIDVLGRAHAVPAAAQPEVARSIAAGPIAGIVETWLGPLDTYGMWMEEAGTVSWVSFDSLGLDPVGVLLSARARQGGEVDALTLRRPAARLVQVSEPGPAGQPSLTRTHVLFDRLRQLLRDAVPMGADAEVAERDALDTAARRSYVIQVANTVLSALRSDADGALSDALAFGRADALPADMPDQAARVADRLSQDLAAFQSGAGYEVLFGADFAHAPVLTGRDALQAQMDQTVSPGVMPLTNWLRDVAATRPRVQAMVDAAEAAEALRDATVLTLHPHQDASAPDWAGLKAAAGTPVTQAGVIVGDVVHPDGGLRVDSWSEVLPDATADAALAIEARAPDTRAPQVILLALSDDPLPEDAPAVALDRMWRLMADRALAPDQMGDLLRLPPVLSFQEPKQ